MRIRVSFFDIVRILLLAYVLLFILYPLAYFTFNVISPGGLREFINTVTSPLFISLLRNSIFVSLSVTALTLLIGVPYAYSLHRYKIRGKELVLALTFLPVMVPPFVGALSLIFLLGRFGTINLLLLEAGLISRPINFLYGLHGVILVETLTLFPWMAINVYNSLLKIDRSLEEAAESLGATPLTRFSTVTLPLIAPGVLTGVFMIFSFSFTDYATPIVVGQYQLLAPQAFINVQQAISEERVRIGSYIVFFMLVVVLAVFFAMRKYIRLREYASLRIPRPVEELSLSGVRGAAVSFGVYTMLALSLLPHIYAFIISLSRIWSFSPFPTAYTLDNFVKILTATAPLTNTAVYSFLATLLCFVIGSLSSYLVLRTENPLNWLIDSLLSIMFIVPGIVVGISYLFAFSWRIPVLNFIGSTWIIMPLMLATRRITYTLRYSFATLLTIRRSLEEAAYVLGEKPSLTFLKIVMPNAIFGILAGTLFSFIEIINELTASLFIYKPGWETITIQLFIEITSGHPSTAAAYAVLLFVISGVSTFIATRLVKPRRV
ncbi:iron ABC transporter permease [Thermofilum sp.]|uniref:ABC transporter permease n=1 Tax=Thermofilum sp. TaxID=1961369 RepID=UPI0031603FDC